MAKVMRARVLIPVAAIALFFFGGWTLRNKLAADRQGNWVRTTRGDLVTGVEVTGTLAALQSDTLGPPQLDDVWDFKIAMMAPEGADVKKGRPVLGFDTSELQRRLDEKSAESDEALKQIDKSRADLALRTRDERLRLAEAEATLRKSELKLDRPADILGAAERKKVELEFKLAKREVAAIRSRLQSLEAAAGAEIRLLQSKQATAAAIVQRTQEAIQKMTVQAPRDGTVIYVTNWRGDKKKTGDNAWKAERIIEIPDLSKMKANGEVDEADAGLVAVGQRVVLRLDAHPDDELRGTITSAGRTVQQKQGTRDPVKILRVEISLDRTDAAKMRPGMRFQGTVELSREKNALLIPREAVFVSDKGPIAYRRGAFRVEEVPLELGRENDKFVHVVSGLAQSDRVLVAKSGDKEEKKS
ncbi:MAG TPA: efflux RND transporter periplasmic adaptor subunit [Thermoanaerobaculia bacterium]|jgi:multidrug resistance efflux pump